MRPRIAVTLLGCVGFILAASGGAPGASAAPETFLVLGVQAHGSGQFVTLRCDPPSGTHPLPEAACRVLGEADGDFTKIPGQPGMMCPDIYDPVTVVASGDFQGRSVTFQHTYPNRCDLARSTAPVFQL
ncbi:MAG: SSI family serine proteinase inhibitor [Pseudonocardiaceae bacterium]